MPRRSNRNRETAGQVLMEDYHQRLLNVARSQDHPQLFYDNAEYIARLETQMARRYCYCGISSRGRGGRNGTFAPRFCGKAYFCPGCASTLRGQYVRKYLPAYRPGDFHFVTLSWDGDVPFSNASAHHCLYYWKAIDHVIKRTEQEHLISGAYWYEEISIRRLVPLRVNPHAHGIFHQVVNMDDLILFLREELRLFRTNHGLEPHEVPPNPRPPSLRWEAIRSVEMMKSTLSYTVKPLTLSKPYREAADRFLAPELRQNRYLVDSNMGEFIRGIDDIRLRPNKRNKPRSIGSMNVQKKNGRYIGNFDWNMEEIRDYVDSIDFSDWHYEDDDGEDPPWDEGDLEMIV